LKEINSYLGKEPVEPVGEGDAFDFDDKYEGGSANSSQSNRRHKKWGRK
jgi:hypothetical protein